MDNRYATALVIACVLSILATVYLSVAIGTQHWYQYSSPAVRGEANVSELRSLYEEFRDGEFDEKTYSDTLFRLNGTVSPWWRCVLVPNSAQWYQEPGTYVCKNIKSLKSDESPVGGFQASIRPSPPPSPPWLDDTRCWSLLDHMWNSEKNGKIIQKSLFAQF